MKPTKDPAKLLLQANNSLFWGTGGLLATVTMYPIWSLSPLTLGATIGSVIIGLAGSLGGLTLLWRDYKVRYHRFKARETKSRKYTAEYASLQELRQRGMLEPNGRLLGISAEGYALFSPKVAFSYILAPQGGHKTSTQVFMSCLFHVVNGVMLGNRSLYISDVKCEIGPVLALALRHLNIEHYFLNPTGAHIKICPHTEFNLFEAAIESYHSTDQEKRKDTTSYIERLADNVAPEPDSDRAHNPFFGDNGHDTAFIFLGGDIVENGYLASPATTYALATDPEMAQNFIEKWAGPLRPGYKNTVCKEIQNRAKSILSLISENPQYWSQFLAHVRRKLKAFDPSGHLSECGQGAIARFGDLRKKPCVIISMSPLKHINTYKTYNSLVSDAVFMSTKIDDAGLPIHLILDEFLTLFIPNFAEEMIVLRGLGISAEMYIQTKALMEKKYGKEDAKAIWDQSDLKQWTAIGNVEDAKELHEMLGSTVVRVKNTSARQLDAEDMTDTWQDEEVPLATLNSLLAMKPRQQYIQVRNTPPIPAEMVPYWRSGLKDWFGPNPLYGGRTPIEPNLVKLEVTTEGFRLLGPKPSGPKVKKLSERPPVVKPTSFIWAYLWAAIFMAGYLTFDIRVPAFLYSWAETRTAGAFAGKECRYVSVLGKRFRRHDTECPIITLDYE